MSKVRLLLSVGGNPQNYVEAVQAAGAEAIAQYLPEVTAEYDGLILCGGTDMDPKYYHQEINGSVNIDHERDTAELALLKVYVEAGKPVLGICRGHQLINVYFGGSLHQHLPETDLHRSGTKTDITHRVSAVENSILQGFYGTSFTVNSAHHQAVDQLGEGLRATAYWNEQYVEAFEHSTLSVFGVQFHPERMCVNNRRADTVDGIEIFRHFIDICQKRR